MKEFNKRYSYTTVKLIVNYFIFSIFGHNIINTIPKQITEIAKLINVKPFLSILSPITGTLYKI